MDPTRNLFEFHTAHSNFVHTTQSAIVVQATSFFISTRLQLLRGIVYRWKLKLFLVFNKFII